MKTNRWKMALLTWTAMFPFSTLISYSFSQMTFMASCPLIIRTFLLTCCLVPYMTFVAFPFLNRTFEKWLQQHQANPVGQRTLYSEGTTADPQ